MTEWIKCSDSLPQEELKVLSYSPTDIEPFRVDYIIQGYNKPFWACRLFRDEERYNVTHWMPLPDKPNAT